MRPANASRTNDTLSIGGVLATLSQRYILVYPVLQVVTGSPKASIMLSQMLFWTRTYLIERPERDGWFWHTQKDWYTSTGLSRHEQDSARATLSGAGFTQERLMGAPARMHYRLDLDILGTAIAQHIHGTYAGWRWEDAALKGMLGRPLAFLRGLVDITGSVTSALYLSDLCQQQRTVDRNALHGYATLNGTQRDLDAGQGWLDLPLGETAQRLGLSTKRLRSARQTLLRLDLIEECSSGGVQPRTFSRLNLNALADALKSQQDPKQLAVPPSNTSQDIEVTGMAGTAIPDMPKAANWNGGIAQSRPSKTGKLDWRNQAIQSFPNRQTGVAESGKLELPKPANRIAGLGTSHIGVYTSDKQPLLPLEPTAPVVANHRQASSSGSVEQKGNPDEAIILPTGLSQVEVGTVRQLLARLPDDATRQLVVDEWAGQLQQPGKLHSPMGYLFGLVERARTGGFTPMVAIRIAQSRNQRRINEAALAAARNTTPAYPPSTVGAVERREIPIAIRERINALGFGSRSGHDAR